MVEKKRLPFGENQTKRYVSEGGEQQLFVSHSVNGGSVELVDYMGGDGTVERVATAGHGRRIFRENLGERDFFRYLVTHGIYEPFRSVQVKASFQSPISVGLNFVYDSRVNINEYSGRYSTMLSSFFVPSVEQIAGFLSGVNEQDMKLERARGIRNLILKRREEVRNGYNRLIGLDMTRELARSGLGIDNDTRYFWKIDLFSLADFVGKQRKLHTGKGPASAYVEKIAEIASAVAPLSWSVLMEHNLTSKTDFNLTLPNDDVVVDDSLSLPDWEPKTTRRVSVSTLEEILFVSRKILDHGEIQAVDYMGDDNSMAEAARTSYGEGTKSLQDNAALVRSLIRDLHTSPIEMAELAIEGKVPVFVDPRQWGRHRTLDNHGFMGYVPLGSQFYMPADGEFKYQDRKNRQGRGKDMDDDDKNVAKRILGGTFESELRTVEELRESQVPEEIVRMAKGVGFYTKRWRTGDTHNWGHFLRLRLDPHAQKEIREYAGAVEDLIKAHTPVAASALRTYIIDSMRLSSKEIEVLGKLLNSEAKIDLDNLDNFGGQGWIVPVDKYDSTKGRKLRAR